MEIHTQQNEHPEIKVVRKNWPVFWISLSIVFLIGFFAGAMIFSGSKSNTKDAVTANPEVQENFAAAQPVDTFQITDALRYDTPLAKAAFKVRYSTKVVELRVELSSLYPVKSLVEFDVNSLNILDLRHVNVNDQSVCMTAGNLIQFNSVGDNTYTILLSNNNKLPHKIDFTISQNELPIYRNSVQINKE